MIDDNDVGFFALGWPILGPVTAVLFVFGILGLLYLASLNQDECTKRPCEHGVARLLEGECVCVEKPKGDP